MTTVHDILRSPHVTEKSTLEKEKSGGLMVTLKRLLKKYLMLRWRKFERFLIQEKLKDRVDILAGNQLGKKPMLR
jgi:hypothetical protein